MVRAGRCVLYFFFPVMKFTSGGPVHTLYMLLQNLWVAVLICLEDTNFLVLSNHFDTLKIFIPSSPHSSMNHDMKGLMNTSHLRQSAVESLTLYTLSACVSPYWVSSTSQGSFFDDGWVKQWSRGTAEWRKSEFLIQVPNDLYKEILSQKQNN